MSILLFPWIVKVRVSKECVILIVDIDLNVLDSTGDRIMAGEELTKEAVCP